jgi:hypothetical protein
VTFSFESNDDDILVVRFIPLPDLILTNANATHFKKKKKKKKKPKTENRKPRDEKIILQKFTGFYALWSQKSAVFRIVVER